MEVGELSLLEELQTGGIWIYPILFFAALSLVIAIYKAFQILDVPTYQGKAKLEGSFRGPFEILEKTAHSYKVISRKFWKKSSMSKSLIFKFVWKSPSLDCSYRCNRSAFGTARHCYWNDRCISSDYQFC